MTDISIEINGLKDVLETTGFNWMFQRGLTAYHCTLLLKPSAVDRIFALSNPLTIKLTNNKTGKSLEIKNLYALKKKHSQKFKSEIELVDPRFFLSYQKVTGRYNVKRFCGILNIMPVQNQILEDYFSYPVAIYRSWSIKNGQVLNWRHRTEATGEPHDVIELADKILKEVCVINGKNFYGGIRGDQTKFTKVKPDDIEYFGEPVITVIQSLLRFGKATTVFLPDGKVYLQPLDDLTYKTYLESLQPKYLLSGKFYDQDNSHVMPDSVDVLFKKEEEVVVEVKENSDNVYDEIINDFGDIKPIARNVVRIPANMRILGEDYVKGEWCPINYMLDEFGVSESLLRDSWFTDMFMNRFMIEIRKIMNPADWVSDPIGVRIAQTLREGYRKYYQFDPSWYEQILDIKPNMVSIVNWVTMSQPPSIVLTNYLIAFRINKFSKRAENVPWAINMEIAPWDESAEELLDNLANPKLDFAAAINVQAKAGSKPAISPFTVSMADKDAGVFQINTNSDLQFNIYDSFFFTVDEDELPKWEITSFAEGWEKVKQEAQHRFITVFQVVRGTPNDKSQMHTINVELDKIGYKKGIFPKWEISSTRINARFNYKNELQDADIMEGFAKGEAEKAIWCLKDRYVGSATFGGIIDIDKAMVGFVDSIRIQERDGGFTTSVSIPEIPPDVDLWNFLPPHVIKKAFRQLGGD